MRIGCSAICAWAEGVAVRAIAAASEVQILVIFPPFGLRQPAHPGDDRIDHGLRLLGQERVAGIGDHHDGDAVAELVLELVHLFWWLERVVAGLQIEQRHAAGRPPLGLFGRKAREALALASLWP